MSQRIALTPRATLLAEDNSGTCFRCGWRALSEVSGE